MRMRIAILVLAALPPGNRPIHAQGARPESSGRAHVSALRDWRFWAGEAVIAASQIVDGVSTCRAFARGAVESGSLNPGGRNCAATSLRLSGAFAFDTTLNLVEHKYFVNERRGAFSTVVAFAVPAAVAPIHFAAAAHNFSVSEKPDISSAIARVAPSVPQREY